MCCIQHSSRVDLTVVFRERRKDKHTDTRTERAGLGGLGSLMETHPAAPCVYYSCTEAGHYKEPNKEMALANLGAVSVGSSPSGSEYGAGKLRWTFSLYTVNIQTGTRY